MSHWNGDRESPSVAGALGSSPGCGPAAASASPPDGSWSLDAKRAVEETPSTRVSLPSLPANAALSERAIATPI